MNVRFHMSLFASAMVLAGFASAEESRFAWGEGWRKGEVVQVARPTEMTRPRYYTCIRAAQPGELDASYIVVKYLERGRSRRTAVKAPPGEAFRPGDPVYVKLGDCSLPPLRRETRPRPTGPQGRKDGNTGPSEHV